MSDVQTAADEAIRANNNHRESRAHGLASELDDIGEVVETTVFEGRDPTRVAVVLSVASIPAPVSDLFDRYRATVDHESINVTADGGLALTVRTPEGFRRGGKRTVREWGTSTAVTFPSLALDASGIGPDDEVDFQARDGAIVLIRREEP